MIAGLGMLISLMIAVYVTVQPKSRWPAYVVVVAIGASTPAAVVFMLGRDVIFMPNVTLVSTKVRQRCTRGPQVYGRPMAPCGRFPFSASYSPTSYYIRQ
jgi:hypothetical protein